MGAPNVSMAPTCFGTVIDVPGAIRDAGRAVRGSPFDLTSGRDGANCCTVHLLPIGIEVSELASEFLKAVAILVMPASQRSS